MWDWNEGLKSSECFGVLFCRSTNLDFESSISMGRGISLSPMTEEPPSMAWLPAISAHQATDLCSCNLQVFARSESTPDEDLPSKIRGLMSSAKLALEAMTVAGVRFERDHYLAGGSLDEPASGHNKITVLPAYTYYSRGGDSHDSQNRLIRAARIYETLSTRLEGRPKTAVIQKALKSLMESLTVTDQFARLYLMTSAIQGLLNLITPESRLHVGQRLEGLVRSDHSTQPSVTEVLLRSLSIRDDFQRVKADGRPIAQRQAAAMEEWIPRLLPFLEAFTLQLLRRTLLKPILTEVLGSESSIAEFWLMPLARREALWGEPLMISPTGESQPVVAVVQGGRHSGPRNTSTIAQAA